MDKSIGTAIDVACAISDVLTFGIFGYATKKVVETIIVQLVNKTIEDKES